MDKEQLIVTMHQNAIGYEKIAKILNIPLLEVDQCLEKHGFSRLEDRRRDRDAEICELYKNGNRVMEISRKLQIDRHIIVDVLRKYNLYENRYANNASEEKKERNQKIIELYEQGMSSAQVAKQMNVCPSTVIKVVRFFNKEVRPQHMEGHSKGTTRNRKHIFNFDFFDIIDTEEKAYWLGFLCADGYVSYGGSIVLGLQAKDKEHIEKFRNVIQAYSTEIKYSKYNNTYKMTLRSVKMASDLTKHGCKQKKSFTLKFPSSSQVPEHLIHHYMRGYFDGDGCISIQDKYRANFSIIGNVEFIEAYDEKLLQYLSDKRKPVKTGHNKYCDQRIGIKSRGGYLQLLEIYNFLYKDATVFLERKKEKFDLIKASKDKSSQKSLDDKDGIKLESRKAC